MSLRFAPMAVLEPDAYYARTGYSVNQPLDLPNTLEAMFDAYFNLPDIEKERFMRGCYWFQRAINGWADSNSAAFVALVNAVEAMLPPRPKNRCSTCNSIVGVSIALIAAHSLSRRITSFAARIPDLSAPSM